MPFIAAGLTILFVCAASGAGLAVIFNRWWIFPAVLSVGPVLIAWAIAHYRRLEHVRRMMIFRCLCVLWCAEVCFVFGGIPGSIVGWLLADDVGECIGWFASAVPLGVLGGLWGWRWAGNSEVER